MMEGWMDRQVDGWMDGWMGGQMDRSIFMRIRHHPHYQINSDTLLAVSVDYKCLIHVTKVPRVVHKVTYCTWAVLGSGLFGSATELIARHPFYLTSK